MADVKFRFTAAFNWDVPGTTQTVAHKPGTRSVPAECADAAAEAGCGHPVGGRSVKNSDTEGENGGRATS